MVWQALARSKPLSMLEKWTGIHDRAAQWIFLSSFLVRVGLTLFGEWMDAWSRIKYSDIDYVVFTDAAREVYEGNSPYDRATYRYTPLLAWALLPTVWHRGWGKHLFTLVDMAIGGLTFSTLRMRGYGEKASAVFSSAFLLHPFVVNISTRGNADSIVCAMALLCLYSLYKRRVDAAAVAYGLSVHLKIYPVIYALPLLLFMDKHFCPEDFPVQQQQEAVEDAPAVASATSTAVAPAGKQPEVLQQKKQTDSDPQQVQEEEAVAKASTPVKRRAAGRSTASKQAAEPASSSRGRGRTPSGKKGLPAAIEKGKQEESEEESSSEEEEEEEQQKQPAKKTAAVAASATNSSRKRAASTGKRAGARASSKQEVEEDATEVAQEAAAPAPVAAVSSTAVVSAVAAAPSTATAVDVSSAADIAAVVRAMASKLRQGSSSQQRAAVAAATHSSVSQALGAVPCTILRFLLLNCGLNALTSGPIVSFVSSLSDIPVLGKPLLQLYKLLLQSLFFCAEFVTATRIGFGILSLLVFSVLTGLFYWMYGWTFLWETYLYHFSRTDNRHNFSPYFYDLYLRYDQPSRTEAGLQAFLPQFGTLLVVGSFLYRDLPMALFIATWIFVTFNKVVTVQYFHWYLCLAPLVLPQTRIRLWPWGVLLCFVWLATELHWNYWAMHLELNGQSVFLEVWLAGLLFFLANVATILALLKGHSYLPVFKGGKLVKAVQEEEQQQGQGQLQQAKQ